MADLENASSARELDPAGPAATGMLVSRFSRVDDVQLVERRHLTAVLEELELSSSGLVDPNEAVEAGKLLGADFLAFGEVTSLQPGQLTLHLRVVETATARVVVSEAVDGVMGSDGRGFVELVDALAERIVVGLQLELSPEEEKAIKTTEQRELDALEVWGGALRRAGLIESVAQCDLADGSHAPADSPRTGSATIAAVRRAAISNEQASSCLSLLHTHLSPDDLSQLYTSVLRLALRDLKRGEPAATFLVSTLGSRPTHVLLADKVVGKAHKKLGKLDAPLALQLLDLLSLDTGMLHDKLVTLDIIAGADASLLPALALRLPDPDLRNAAAERLVNLRIDASPHALVREQRSAAAASVLSRGFWPLPAGAAVTALSWTASPSDPTSVSLRARPYSSSALLDGLNEEGDRIPARWPLTALSATVSGVDQPVQLCPPAEPFDPTPCIDPAALTLSNPWATLTATHLVMASQLGVDDVVKLGRRGTSLRPPIQLHGATLEALEVPVVFERVRSMIVVGGSEQSGPAVSVDLVEISHERVLVGVKNDETGERMAAVVPLHDAEFFAGSQGGWGPTGANGVDGADGSTGAPGANATCDRKGERGHPGGPGGNGTDGSPGGRGANGGDVTVTVRCGEQCRALLTFAETHIVSLGGPGGLGGRAGMGGKGGSGGPGGSDMSCEVYNASLDRTDTKRMMGGMSGLPGQHGNPGKPGDRGPSGDAGGVTVRVAR